MDRGLVSVIVPAYRADRFLPESLDTVRRQTYASWEVIVVEDGSRDNTEELVQEFSKSVSNHRVVYRRHEKNQGLGATRNTAIAQARGEFVAFLDADDLWRESHLEAAVTALERESADVAFSTALMFEDGTGHLIGLWGPTRERLLATPRVLRKFPNWFFHRNFLIPSATVIRRTVLDAVGCFDTDSRLTFVEDLDYWLRCVKAGLKFHHVPGCHCLYRKGESGAATSNMPMILGRQAFVLTKHLDLEAVPRRLRRRQAAYFHAAAAIFHVDRDPRVAAEHLYRGWRIRPERLDLLLLSAWTRWAVPLLPDMGIAKAIRRRRGYD